ncbi:MAG: hypothetical protein QOI86_2388, partial [Actinomycetota bacterium]|nr:hypothetical protein [Actinomycetota bacterium]
GIRRTFPASLRAVLLQRLKVEPDATALIPAFGQRLLVLVGHGGPAPPGWDLGFRHRRFPSRHRRDGRRRPGPCLPSCLRLLIDVALQVWLKIERRCRRQSLSPWFPAAEPTMTLRAIFEHSYSAGGTGNAARFGRKHIGARNRCALTRTGSPSVSSTPSSVRESGPYQPLRTGSLWVSWAVLFVARTESKSDAEGWGAGSCVATKAGPSGTDPIPCPRHGPSNQG